MQVYQNNAVGTISPPCNITLALCRTVPIYEQNFHRICSSLATWQGEVGALDNYCLQKVVRSAARNHRLACSWARVKLQESILQMLINLHDSCLVTTSVAVIWSRENGDNISILRPIVPLHDQLMCSCNERQAVVVIERLRYILPKRIPCSSWRYSPSTSIIWI